MRTRKLSVQEMIDTKKLETFIRTYEQENHLPVTLVRKCKADRLFWRKIKGEGILQPGHHRRYTVELQDELVDYVNYTYFILFLIEEAFPQGVEAPPEVVHARVSLLSGLSGILTAWQDVAELPKLLGKPLDAADRARAKAKR